MDNTVENIIRQDPDLFDGPHCRIERALGKSKEAKQFLHDVVFPYHSMILSYMKGSTLNLHNKLITMTSIRMEGRVHWKDLLFQAPILRNRKDLYVDLSYNRLGDQEIFNILPSFIMTADPAIVDLSNNLISGFNEFHDCVKKLARYKVAHPNENFKAIILLNNPVDQRVFIMKRLLRKYPILVQFLVWVSEDKLDSYAWSEVIEDNNLISEAQRVHKMCWSTLSDIKHQESSRKSPYRYLFQNGDEFHLNGHIWTVRCDRDGPSHFDPQYELEHSNQCSIPLQSEQTLILNQSTLIRAFFDQQRKEASIIRRIRMFLKM